MTLFDTPPENELVRGALPLLPGVKASATMSPCGTYRYGLHRDWWPKVNGHVLWIMLNPSAASAEVDDRTIRKCQTLARAWGYDGITVCNLFALRSTSPEALFDHPDPVGEANDDVLRSFLGAVGVGLAVAAWGVHGRFCRRDADVISLAAQEGRDLHVVSLTKDGHPGHPLYLSNETQPQLWMSVNSGVNPQQSETPVEPESRLHSGPIGAVEQGHGRGRVRTIDHDGEYL